MADTIIRLDKNSKMAVDKSTKSTKSTIPTRTPHYFCEATKIAAESIIRVTSKNYGIEMPMKTIQK